MKNITLDVCQGVGDIFWVYQKFAPHFDEINFNVCRIMGLEHEKVQNRSAPFLELLPKVNKIGNRDVNHWGYTLLASKSFEMKDVIESDADHSYYSCNKPLEQEVRLEDIDPEYEIEETVEIRSESVDTPEEYVCLYVSGNTLLDRCKKEVWSVEQWVEFVTGFYEKFNLKLPLVMVGASYDQEALTQVKSRLEEAGLFVHEFVDCPPANVVHILKHAEYFLDYASGLGILADNLDVKQVMMYPKSIKGLLYSWCKKRNLNEGVYNAALFEDSPEEVLRNVT